jgi:serine/threonine-protein kinase
MGVYPDEPTIPLRVEAAAYQGKPIYFRLIAPWEQPAVEKQSSASIARRISTTVGVVLMLSCLGGCLFLARHNLRLGRGDRKGAYRLALFMMVVGGVDWLTHSHVPEIRFEWQSFQNDLSSTLYFAGSTWLVYIAIEPFLRRRWPDLIISWNRLLAGNYRDPLVGRDILIGAVAGIGSWVLATIPRLVPKLTGQAYEIANFNPFSGLRRLINDLNGDLLDSFLTPMLILFLALFFSAFLRKRWQVAIIVSVIGIAPGFVANNFVSIYSFAVVPIVFLIVTLRYGWLAACFCSFVRSLVFFYPMTANFSAWYAEATIVVLIILVGLILYGFYTSVAGRQLFRPKLLTE